MRLIVLLGPKHSGKTSAGKELAALFSCDFIDLDDYITQRTGKSPRALYVEGPEIFKKAEAAALAEVLAAGFSQPEATQAALPLVIASGGGLIDNPDARSLLENNAAVVSVFLDISVKTAWDRISEAGELPPFLKTENPQETHRSLHERRAAAYRQFAALVIKADGKSPREIAREIANRLHI
jgi:shikimate kinase